MRPQISALVLALAALCSAQKEVNVEFEGDFKYEKHLRKEGKECVEWDVEIEVKADRHHLPYIIPACMKWKPQEDDDDVTYDLAVVKVMHGCKKWDIVANGVKVRPVCSKVQKREALPEAQLIDSNTHHERPEPEVMGIEAMYERGKECTKWGEDSLNDFRKGGKLIEFYPVVRPVCKKWKKHEGDEIIYDLTTVHIVPGCKHWKTGIAADGKDVRTYCSKWKGMPTPIDDGRGVIKRSTPDSSPATPFKGLLKEVQKTVHTLQAQVAQVQHNHVSQLKTDHGLSGSDGPNQGSTLQRLQLTVNRMQSKLALAKYSLHSLSSKSHGKNTKRPGGHNQGFLQDLQHSIHSVKTQLAKARHSLHAKTGRAKNTADSGFDQGNLQAMQHTASALQSQLAKARHTLHAHLNARDTLPTVNEDDEPFDGEAWESWM